MAEFIHPSPERLLWWSSDSLVALSLLLLMLAKHSKQCKIPSGAFKVFFYKHFAIDGDLNYLSGISLSATTTYFSNGALSDQVNDHL